MSAKPEKALLIFYKKLALGSGLVSERKIWILPRSDRYSEGCKYSLVLANPKTHEVVLLYDNHWPKGPHVHWDGRERAYEFLNFEKLLKDFIQESEVEERRYCESKKNRD